MSERSGTAVALLPGTDRSGVPETAAVVVPTGLGESRNALVVRAADAVIAVGGGFGTLMEIALAIRTGTPVVGYRTWHLRPPNDPEPDDPLIVVLSPDDAVDVALALAAERIDMQ